MYSKNNKRMQEQKNAPKAQRFSLRKLSIGTVSVLLGTLMFVGGTSSASADEVNTATTSTDNTSTTAATTSTDSNTVTLKSSSAASDSSDANSESAAAKETATVAAAAATTATDTNSTAAASTAAASTTAVAATAADSTSTAASTAATDNVGSGSGTITDAGKAKGLTDSDATPAMSDDNGASVVIDNSGVPSGYEIDPTTGRYTFGIANLSGYNTSHNTNYYIRVSTNATGDEDIAYIQLVDANTNTVIKEYTVTPDSGKVQITELSNVVDNNTVYYEAAFTKTTDSITHLTSRSIGLSSKVGTQYMQAVYDSVTTTAGVGSGLANFTFPTLSTKETKYIAKDAAGNETVIAIHDETGKLGQKYTISDARDFKGYDLISSPSEDEKSGTLSLSYKIGDKYVRGYALRIANDVYAVKLYEITGTDGSVLEEIYVARGISTIDLSDASATKKIYAGDNGKELTAPSLDLLNDPTVWKLGFTTTIPIKPGEWSTEGNKNYDGKDNQGYFFTEDYLKSLGFSDNDVLGATSNWQDYTGKAIHTNLVNWPLSNALQQGQKTADYYYAPQGQVKINYVTEDGTVIKDAVAAYENSGNNTSYDVTGSDYRPTIITTADGKTYRYTKTDKSKGTAGTTTVNGYTYNLTPSDSTGTIHSNTVNDVYYVYELVTYQTEEETKDVTRTIEYYDSVTGEKIPSDLEDTVTQTATMKRNKILDDQDNFIGYGTVSADGTTYTLSDDWTVDAQTWTQQDSKDLSDYGYTAPDRASIAAVTVDGNTMNVTEKVYYGHQTTPVTPDDPKNPGTPINPKGNTEYPDGVSETDLKKTVTRTINYVDTEGNKVNGAPNGTSQEVQSVTFTRTAIVDKVTGKILGYDTNNDGKVDTENADRAWDKTSDTLSQVDSATPASVGYDNVDKSSVAKVTVVPTSDDITETVTYSKNHVTTYTATPETKDVTRTIEYYDSVTGEKIPSDLEDTVTQTTTLTRYKITDDQGNFIGYGTVSADGTTYTLSDDWTVDAQTWTQQDSKDLSDYGYTAPDRASIAAVTVDGNTTNVTEKVYYGHQTTPVTPDDPKNPGAPINPKGNTEYPDGVSETDLKKTVTRTINYVDTEGNKVNGAPNGTSQEVQSVTFTRTAIVDKVTGKILGYDTNNDGKVDTENADRAWDKTSDTLSQVDSATPASVGYDNVDKSSVAKVTVVPTSDDITETVTYSKNPETPAEVTGKVTYIDDTTGVTLDVDNTPTGKVGEKINYTTADKIKNYENQGYELVSNDFTDGVTEYKQDGNEYVVHLKHKTQTITPNDPNPVTPGQPINPDDPNSPVYPTDAARENLVKDATQTVHYVDNNGNKVFDDKVQTQKDAFTRTVTIDKVTGKVISSTDWTGTKTFDEETTPVKEGYHADKKTAGGLTATVDNPDVEDTVVYTPNGKIIPVDPNGNQIPDAPTPTYPTDPTDPTKVVPNEPIPDVPNWTPVDPSPVTPEDPAKDTPVPYTKDETPAEVNGKVTYIDDTTGVTLDVDNTPTGKVGEKINYTTADKIKNYEDQGYELVSNDFTDGTTEYKKDGNNYEVHLKHKTQTITPNDPNPVTPGQPINPDDPNSPVYPSETDRSNLVKDATQTVHYVDNNGNKVFDDKVQTQKDAFTRTVTIDKVTGKVISSTDWTGTKTFDEETTPVKEGYHADKKTAGGLTATPDNPDVEDTVVYTPNGKIIPVDPNGTPIPGADTPTYPTDPTDPTKVVPNEPIPDVPNWTPVDPSPVTPTDPGKDTPVPYKQNETPAEVTGKVTYIDDTTGVTLDVDNTPTGKVGEKINYTTADKIKNYEDQGYELVSNDFTDGTTEYKKDGNEYVVHLKHKTQTITPNDPNPVTPGQPINPDDPNSPVYPTDAAHENLVKDATQTVHYVDNNGNKVFEDKVQTQKDAFTRTVTIDKVTGKIIETTDWTGSKTFDEETTPVKEGYHADKKTAGGLTATVDNPDVEDTVVYTPNGKIIPVDPNGNQIPDAPTPTYPTDPTDPTKVVPNEPIPDVPNWTPVDPSPVTPTDPGKDTPVPYKQNETPSTKYGLTEKFVDVDGNELSPSVNKGTDYKTGDKYDVDGDAKVIEGYVLVKKTDTTGTFETSDKTAVFTYQKVGKLIPVDENGTPIPGADTPSYKNDPNDPTKVVPNEPIPDVPNWTPVDPSPVTPADPTKDTPVPYKQNETPSTKYGLTEKFVDVDGNELSPSVNKGTNYSNGDNFDVTGDAKVINGYVLVKQENTTGTFTDGDETATFVYKKIGKIIPVDENGTPIPGADTPSYRNDPNDPTKVIPNQPIPNVDGWTPVDPSAITPNDPTEDTPVPYTKKSETPVTPTTPDQPQTPATPDTPAVPGQPATPVNTSVTPAAPSAVNAEKKATLPQTGNDENEATAAVGLGFASLASMMAMLGLKKRRRD